MRTPIEYDNVSMGTPVALRFARALLTAEPELGTVLLVAACRESYLLDYGNERSRFMFNFGDGAVAGLLTTDAERNVLLGSHAITDGSFSLQVKVPAGGSVEPASHATVDGRRHFLDVADPVEMKGGLDEVSLPNFVAAAEGALARSGATLADVSYLCGIHMKRSMHGAIVEALGLGLDRAAYLDDTGHMSGVDPLLALDRATRGGDRARRRSRPPARRRYRLHVGCERRTLGSEMSALTELIGKELGPTEWFEVDQERIDRFAEATDDPQWIHVDPVRAAEGPFGTTIAHGYLTLSLLVPLMGQTLQLTGYRMGINYGVNKVRFPAPLPSGSRIRATFQVQSVEEVPGGEQSVVLATVEREGGDKPVCVAELVSRMIR